MLSPHPVTLQRGALRLEPLMEADIPELVALAERNRAELTYMSGPLRPDWYRHALAEQREGRAVVFSVRMAEQLVGTTRFADFNIGLPAAERLGGDEVDGQQRDGGEREAAPGKARGREARGVVDEAGKGRGDGVFHGTILRRISSG